jgi:hypothetical protein
MARFTRFLLGGISRSIAATLDHETETTLYEIFTTIQQYPWLTPDELGRIAISPDSRPYVDLIFGIIDERNPDPNQQIILESEQVLAMQQWMNSVDPEIPAFLQMPTLLEEGICCYHLNQIIVLKIDDIGRLVATRSGLADDLPTHRMRIAPGISVRECAFPSCEVVWSGRTDAPESPYPGP